MQGKITAKMIAEELGVSTATVDRVLNNRKGVSEKTIKRVKEKADELGYRPNTAAKFLSTQKRTEVGFILPVLPEYFWDEVEKAIEKSAELYADFGFGAHIHRVEALPKERQINYIKKMIENNPYDALVISPIDADPFTEVINEGIQRGIPIFTLNNDVPKSNRISFVGGDYYQAGFLAAELIYLFAKELNEVILIREDEDSFQMANKEKGFRDYFQFNGLNIKIKTIPVISDHIQLDEVWKKEILRSTNAIYVANGILGEIAEYLHENQYNDSKILIGHDMSEKIYQYIERQIVRATICQDPASQAMITVQNVFDYLLQGDKELNAETIIKLEIVTKANAQYYINFDKN
ncbi:LacI family DNA-binding transcriptional regulator [Bacillus sp. FJAT-50079]|uniref:LacI family DNA-binding transcriptional regulator n=1 Tax=Bacillus sp. FJAT-50079 TaxID=2833577 RepID=UPI001BC9474B|nr:LacI family DNA-binding transcriptional regulator [Bacillus sp. FJAT-50079]MBS4208654.1 LacI family DNA-binding transcriptional regulator [Bacillus sp. FJAT-50079]